MLLWICVRAPVSAVMWRGFLTFDWLSVRMCFRVCECVCVCVCVILCIVLETRCFPNVFPLALFHTQAWKSYLPPGKGVYSAPSLDSDSLRNDLQKLARFARNLPSKKDQLYAEYVFSWHVLVFMCCWGVIKLRVLVSACERVWVHERACNCVLMQCLCVCLFVCFFLFSFVHECAFAYIYVHINVCAEWYSALVILPVNLIVFLVWGQMWFFQSDSEDLSSAAAGNLGVWKARSACKRKSHKKQTCHLKGVKWVVCFSWERHKRGHSCNIPIKWCFVIKMCVCMCMRIFYPPLLRLPAAPCYDSSQNLSVCQTDKSHSTFLIRLCDAPQAANQAERRRKKQNE